MARIKMLSSNFPTADTRTTLPMAVPEKIADPIYSTPEYRAWREAVIANAGRRCEAVDNGKRCRKTEPFCRMYADHRAELKDGGSAFDIANGQCLCGAHHVLKTNAARAARNGIAKNGGSCTEG
jgi:5-methylcytosine-specific restriction enzyme A